MSKELPLKPRQSNDKEVSPQNYPAPPKNPNKRPTTINMDRSIGRMKSHDMDVIRLAK